MQLCLNQLGFGQLSFKSQSRTIEACIENDQNLLLQETDSNGTWWAASTALPFHAISAVRVLGRWDCCHERLDGWEVHRGPWGFTKSVECNTVQPFFFQSACAAAVVKGSEKRGESAGKNFAKGTQCFLGFYSDENEVHEI